MLRIFFAYILPLLAPTVIYLLWTRASRARMAATGKADPDIPLPWVWLAVSGVVLLAITLSILGFWGRNEPGTHYEPPHVEDGRIVPGHSPVNGRPRHSRE
jgi:hypothetical protein